MYKLNTVNIDGEQIEAAWYPDDNNDEEEIHIKVGDACYDDPITFLLRFGSYGCYLFCHDCNPPGLWVWLEEYVKWI